MRYMTWVFLAALLPGSGIWLTSAERAWAASAVTRATASHYAKPEPAYAPWGRMAVRLVQQRYPDAQLIDYLHVGQTHPAAGQSAETFKLWLRRGTREFGVFVTITFDDNTKHVRQVSFRESDR